jgi:hypothetical protein
MTTSHVRLGIAAAIVAASGAFIAVATAGLVPPFLLVLAASAGAILACHR